MNLAGRFLDTVTVQSQTSSNNYGDPNFGSQRTIKGRVMTELRKEMTASGTTVRTVSMFVTDQAIAQGDRLWLPGADTTDAKQARRLGLVKSAKTLDGATTHYEVDL